MKPLVIRADAGPAIGTGHVMRCLALAEAWQDAVGGDVFFVLACDAQPLEARLKEEGIEIIHICQAAGTAGDADKTASIARTSGADWIVVDGYQFGADFQKRIKDAGFSLLFIDDYGHADHYYADIVLNQNIYANMSFYKIHEPYTRFLLGPEYVLLRKEFLKRPFPEPAIREIARRILITLGGSDKDNITFRVIEAVKAVDIKDIKAIVVAGGSNPNSERLEGSLKNYPGLRLIKNARNMPELMAWADIAISAGGSTCWELLFMRIPSLVIPIADNQKPIVCELETRHLAQGVDVSVAKNPGELAKIITGLLVSKEKRSAFSERMVQCIDGKGPVRVICAMGDNGIMLRRVEPSDCNQIWLWINDPLVRSVSFNPEPIPLERHKEWFSSVLNNPAFVYYIALDGIAKPIGQVRFRITSHEAVISVLLDPGYRGRSLGSLLIRDATEKFFQETEIEKVKAFIKTGNEVSRRAFTTAGYSEIGLSEYSGEQVYLLIKQRARP